MTRAMMVLLALACCCMTIPPDIPDAGTPPVVPGGGGGGGGGPGNLPDGGLGWGPDGGLIKPIPGSGQHGDQGMGVLVMVRVDRGTANIASDIESMANAWVDALDGAGFKTSALAVGDLYTGKMLWATRLLQQPNAKLVDVLRAASSPAMAAPQGCTTSALADVGGRLGSVTAAGIMPFAVEPGALLTVLVETGTRPQTLASCPNAAIFGTDPASWARFAGFPLERPATRFAFIATSESEPLDRMRARCLGSPGFTSGALDSLAPSDRAFFGPLADGLDQIQIGLAGTIDVCDALGASRAAAFKDFADRWYRYLATR